ncbi:Transcriptional regulator, GntR family [Caballeronia glathei]|jgi:DNA-binding GntR family transcriptional regulator|nr:GntR family transcriptional regulator [Caballeronia glathei]CDY73613.1 Transcriptional regulator, GntR family [Caballeronia glathei]
MPRAEPADDPIKPPREKSTETVYQGLRAKILNNELRPGMQLLEQEIVALFGVSRTPVREALLRLERENLLQIIPRHGVRVRQVSLADIEDIDQIQTSLEASAIAMVAATKPRAKGLAPLSAACDAMDRAARKADYAAWWSADEAFFMRLVELPANPRLAQIVGECREQIRRVRDLTARVIAGIELSSAPHRAMIDAMRAGDAALAESLCRDHRAATLRAQIDTLTRLGILEV